MSIQWSSFRDMLKRTLGETFTPDDLADYMNEALVAITSHTAETKTIVTVLTANTSDFTLADDFFEVGPILIHYGIVEKYIAKPYRLTPGSTLPVIPLGTPHQPAFYYRLGQTVKFVVPILAGRTVEMSYFAYWDKVENDTDLIPVERWMESPLKWYCFHAAQMKAAVGAARIRNFNTKEDSGNPVENPFLQTADYCLKRYQQAINEHPIQDRSSWDKQG